MDFNSDSVPTPSSVQARPCNQLLTVTLSAVNSLQERCEDRESENEYHETHTGALDKTGRSELVVVGPEMPSSSTVSQCLSGDSHGDLQTDGSQSVGSDLSSSHSVKLSVRKLREIDSPFAVKQSVGQQEGGVVNTPAALIDRESLEANERTDESNRRETQALQGVKQGALNSSNLTSNFVSPFHKPSLAFSRKKIQYGLKQGVATDQTLPSLVQPVQENNSEIIISSWGLEPQEKQLREDFARRCLPKSPVKPTVQAWVHKRPTKLSRETEAQVPQWDVSSTMAAAAAASAAVVSSGQYLESVHALQSKVVGLTAHLESLKDRQESEMVTRQRNLQEQIERHTQLRLEHLERLGEQQGRIETHLASVLITNGKERREGTKEMEEGGAHHQVISRAIQTSPPEIGGTIPLRRQMLTHNGRWKVLPREEDATAASPPDSLCGDRPLAPVPLGRLRRSSSGGVSVRDKKQNRELPRVDEKSKIGGVSPGEVSTSVQSDKAMTIRHGHDRQSSQDRVVRMESALETMQNELRELHQRTSEWRQRLEDRKALSRPPWLPLPPCHQLTEVEDVLQQCEISRRNLEDNIACVRRQGENRFWYEKIADGNPDRAFENGTRELKRSIDKTIAAVSAQIKDELTADHVQLPTSDNHFTFTVRGRGVSRAQKGILRSGIRRQPGTVLRETQRGTVRKLRGKQTSTQIEGRSAQKKGITAGRQVRVHGGQTRYHVQTTAPVSSREYSRVPYYLTRDRDGDGQSSVPRVLRPPTVQRPFRGAMAVPLCPPRRTALSDWDIAEKDESTSEVSLLIHPEKISVSVQVGDETGNGDDRIGSAATRSDRLSQLTKRVLSPVNIDSLSPNSSHSISTSSEPCHSSVSTEREREKETRDLEAPTEGGQFSNYLTVREVDAELYSDQVGLPGFRLKDDEDKPAELERIEEQDVETDNSCDDIPSLQGISVDGQTVQRCSPQNTGPPFPPQPPANVPVCPVTERDGGDDQSINIVERQICEWVEKELLAQVFSHVDPPGPEQRLAVQLYSPISSASLDSDSSEDMRTQLVNGRIVQLFVDAGLPVDVEFVEHVAREVISDMLVASLGHRTSGSLPSVPVHEHKGAGLLSDGKDTPRSSDSGDEEIPTPLPTRSPSPVDSDLVIQNGTEEKHIEHGTPPLSQQEESSDEERSTKDADAQATAGYLSDRSSSVDDVGDVVGETVATPADTLSKESSSGEDEVSHNRIVTPRVSDESETHSVTSGQEFELSASLQLVAAETQTSEQEPLAAALPQVQHPLSVSGTSSSSSVTSSDAAPTTEAVTTTLTTDPEISEGEYLLVDPSTKPGFDGALEVSEGEFPGSPGDTRFARGKKPIASTLLKSESLFHQQDVKGDIHGFLKGFLESSPIESALSESSTSSEPQCSKKSRRRTDEEVDPLCELLSRIEPSSQHVTSGRKPERRIGDDEDAAHDISVGEVVSSSASGQRTRIASVHQTGVESPEDLSHGEVVSRDIVKEVIAVSVAERATAEPGGHSPGEIPLAELSNQTIEDLVPAVQVGPTSDNRSSASVSPASLALAQAAFQEVQCSHQSPPRSGKKVQDEQADIPLLPSLSEETATLTIEQDSPKQDGRSLRSLFSKANRTQHHRRVQDKETIHLPSVFQLQLHKPRFQQPLVVQPMRSTDEPPSAVETSNAVDSASPQFRRTEQVDITLPGTEMHREDDEDTFGSVSSISCGDF